MARSTPAIRLVETRRSSFIAEKQYRYDVLLDGYLYGQLYFNMTGYVGYLPTPSGAALNIGERSISTYRKEVARLNQEFAKAREGRS